MLCLRLKMNKLFTFKPEKIPRWGDPVMLGAPEFDPTKHTSVAQAQQFPYILNNSGKNPTGFQNLSGSLNAPIF